MPHPGQLHAGILHCRLLPGFAPGEEDRVPRFLRSVAAPLLPYMSYHAMVRCWAVLTGPDTYTVIDMHASGGAMTDSLAGLAGDEPGIETLTSNIEITARQTGPVEDIYLPASSLRVLEANPDVDPNLPFVAVAHARILPAVAENPDRYATIVDTLVPLLLPTTVENGILAAWLVNSGNDTVTSITAYTTAAERQRALEAATGPGPLGQSIRQQVELLAQWSGPALNFLKLAAEGVAADNEPPPPSPAP